METRCWLYIYINVQILNSKFEVSHKLHEYHKPNPTTIFEEANQYQPNQQQ